MIMRVVYCLVNSSSGAAVYQTINNTHDHQLLPHCLPTRKYLFQHIYYANIVDMGKAQ